MTEKDLIQKLNNAKNVSPDAKWLASNRELFLTQIANSGADNLTIWQIVFINFKSFAKASSGPAFASVVFLFVLLASSVFGHKLFSQAKPNDSLYIARVISEKAKLNTVLDSEARNKMALKFATDHARDISQVLSNPEFNNDDNKAEVEKLNENFDKEIETVKNKMATIATNREERIKKEEARNENNEVAVNTDSDINVEGQASTTNNLENEGQVSIASDLQLKSDNGIEIVIKDEETDLKDPSEKDDVSPATITDSVETMEDSSSTTEEIAGAMLDEVVNGEVEVDNILISEVKKLFEQKQYTEAINKLNQISKMVE
ncbi:MAG TPA: hypothetical protein VFD51_01605 [Patescibacteria group bacterium]|nr:hypothetical protein [Patescibacteria group bacterium]